MPPPLAQPWRSLVTAAFGWLPDDGCRGGVRASQRGENAALFGMLDYRAHKLYWLICLPFRMAATISFYIVIVVAIVIAQSTSYSVPVKIAIAWVTMEGISMVLFLVIWGLIFWAIKRIFFWVIDVVPAHGANAMEAREVVLTGRAFELGKKILNDIENWDYDDTCELVSKMNWRARLLFPVKQRLENAIAELHRIHEETGKQPGDLGTKAVAEIREQLFHGQISWLEKALIYQPVFNSIVGFVLIVLAIYYGIGRI
jgi:hypothetical protein